VSRLDELVFVERLPSTGTRALQPDPVSPDDDFRVLTEFDAARSELFLARAAVLVEGQTEKLVLPFVFSALAYDADREAISIVEWGGKPNIPFSRVSAPRSGFHSSSSTTATGGRATGLCRRTER
jgi:predicted ATP-dependent endonuclease of OLD family